MLIKSIINFYMVNLRKGFLDVFVTFGDMVAGTLGIKADTKKSDIGAYLVRLRIQ
ncbi:Variable outer membrane protein (plasmid) [Borrelia crocidurae DOU]|uniref:Variable large protein n=1 Tax=Borrelia crocidurae DOU TaxID=1293575 RepID=W5SK26_9SPIR|nr:Variable outer membrane protein [Borrelia crocidurae DOU]